MEPERTEGLAGNLHKAVYQARILKMHLLDMGGIEPVLTRYEGLYPHIYAIYKRSGAISAGSFVLACAEQDHSNGATGTAAYQDIYDGLPPAHAILRGN